MEFQAFNKIPRLNREIVITEKIDGTNAQIYIGALTDDALAPLCFDGQDFGIYAGSRNRWITPENDNFGFARWVQANANELADLGPGTHYGEWWGKGIQRGYGLDEKRFSLFNVGKWNADTPPPSCCHVVPVLYTGPFDQQIINQQVDALASNGSFAADFHNPEGIIVYHTAARQLFKVTCKGDDKPKGQ